MKNHYISQDQDYFIVLNAIQIQIFINNNNLNYNWKTKQNIENWFH